MSIRLLALAASDRFKAEFIIAYPVCNIMEETSSVIVRSVNIRNLINTRREMWEACIIEAACSSCLRYKGLVIFEVSKCSYLHFQFFSVDVSTFTFGLSSKKSVLCFVVL